MHADIKNSPLWGEMNTISIISIVFRIRSNYFSSTGLNVILIFMRDQPRWSILLLVLSRFSVCPSLVPIILTKLDCYCLARRGFASSIKILLLSPWLTFVSSSIDYKGRYNFDATFISIFFFFFLRHWYLTRIKSKSSISKYIRIIWWLF